MLPMHQARANIDLLDAMANHDLRLSYFFREAKLGILTSVQVTSGLSLFGMACYDGIEGKQAFLIIFRDKGSKRSWLEK